MMLPDGASEDGRGGIRLAGKRLTGVLFDAQHMHNPCTKHAPGMYVERKG
jgi:hypothetical protein